MPRLPLFAIALMLPFPALADTSLDGLKERIVGTWTSISCEMRPTAAPDGPPMPTYLTRDFTYDANGGFAAVISTFADPACSAPLATFDFAGEIVWHDENPAAEGAWSQDYVLNRKLQMTVHAPEMAEMLNANFGDGVCGAGPVVPGETRDALGQPCPLVKILDGNDVVVDHDMLYVRADTPNMLFMGGKHVDGTGFYAPENRPEVGLQQPLIRVE